MPIVDSLFLNGHLLNRDLIEAPKPLTSLAPGFLDNTVALYCAPFSRLSAINVLMPVVRILVSLSSVFEIEK